MAILIGEKYTPDGWQNWRHEMTPHQIDVLVGLVRTSDAPLLSLVERGIKGAALAFCRHDGTLNHGDVKLQAISNTAYFEAFRGVGEG